MTQTYRTDDLGRWGLGKGSNLTPAERDINDWDIIQRLIAQEARPDPSAGIDHFSVSGTDFYVHMTDTTVLGPYTLPVATFNATGTWQPSTSYAVLDTFTNNGSLYVVIFAHTSALTFDPGANDAMGHDYYSLMIETPGSSLPTGGATAQVLQKVSGTDFNTTWGYKLPTGGNRRQVLLKNSGTNQDAVWDDIEAEDVGFTPVTDSTLSSTNVADALEELATGVDGVVVDAVDVTYTPSTGSGLTDDNVADALDTLGEQSVLGRQMMWIPASAWQPQLTNGPSSGLLEMTTNKNMVKTLDFDASTQEYAQFDVAMPKSWDEGPVYFKVFWSHPTAATYGVAIGLQGASIGDAFSIDTPFSTAAVYVTDTGGSADTIYASGESAAVMIYGSPAFGYYTMLRLTRNPANAGDTLNVDARIHGIQLFYNINASTDD